MKRWLCGAALALAVACAGRAAPAAQAEEGIAAERRFLWNEANALAARASTPAGYEAAVERYRDLARLGVRNGPLFYNMGTLLLQAGRKQEAFEALARAECYMGYDPDLRHNMALALAVDGDERSASVPWNRLVFAWHFGLPLSLRLLVAAGAFSGLWLAAALRLAGWRRGLQLAVVALVVALALFGSSAAVSLLH